MEPVWERVYRGDNFNLAGQPVARSARSPRGVTLVLPGDRPSPQVVAAVARASPDRLVVVAPRAGRPDARYAAEEAAELHRIASQRWAEEAAMPLGGVPMMLHVVGVGAGAGPAALLAAELRARDVPYLYNVLLLGAEPDAGLAARLRPLWGAPPFYYVAFREVPEGYVTRNVRVAMRSGLDGLEGDGVALVRRFFGLDARPRPI